MGDEQVSKDSDRLYKRPDYLSNLKAENIWLKLGPLINNQVDLNYGYPDFETFPEIKDAYSEALTNSGLSVHQYSRLLGRPRMVKALGKYYEKLFDREIDPLNEILITPGTEAGLYLAFNSVLSEGDEIIVFEPFYTFYNMIPKLRNAKVVYIPLKPKPGANKKGYTTSADWVWDDAQLEAAFNQKTKAVIICTPSNPLGKVLSPQELSKIASLCIKHNVICFSDEVYHQMVYDEGLKHTSIATLPGMWERTITFGSSGKLLSTTGLKIGWMIGDKRLIHNCNLIFVISLVTCSSLSQEVVAISLEKELQRYDTPECYFSRIKREGREKRDFMAKKLIEFGLEPVIPESGYFIIADISKIAEKLDLEDDPDFTLNIKFVKYMIKKGVIFSPCSNFFSPENIEYHSNYIRICFFKKNETIEAGIDVLKSIKPN